jgi:NADPH:quinone reductase-like Zn-dependent oxidoreductase
MISISALLGDTVVTPEGAPRARIEFAAGVVGTFGTVQCEAPSPTALGPNEVRIRVLAFSCNYRDRGLLASEVARARSTRVTPFGSEFCGVAEAVGASVRSIRVGDRVMGNNAFGSRVRRGGPTGIPTNSASMECLHLDARQLHSVPARMDTIHAAAFSLAAQTAAAMVRRLALQRGDRLVVTSARSVTSLFTIQLAAAAGAHVTAVSRTFTAADDAFWRSLGARAVEPVTTFRPGDASARSRSSGRFDAAVDPFHDLNLPWVVPHLRFGGRVITCGFEAQSGAPDRDVAARESAIATTLKVAGMRNITIMGHCLGESRDLRAAVRAHRAGALQVPIDAVYTRAELGAFVVRSFAEPSRRGKVVCTHA